MEPNEDLQLSRLLREWHVPGASAQLEERVLSARTDPGIWGDWRGKVVLLATNAALLTIGVLLSSVSQPVRQPLAPSPVVAAYDTEDDAPFVPVPYSVPLDSYETATVLRVRIPVSALISAGYPVPAVDPAAIVLADVLVGDDGRAHAIRLVSEAYSTKGGD